MIVAFIAGGFADSYRFAALFGGIAYAWFRGVFAVAGLVPEFAPGHMLTAEWTGYTLGMSLMAALCGAAGRAIWRACRW